MIPAAITLLALATFAGVSLVVMGVRYRRSSLALGAGHAAMAVAGLAVLVWEISGAPVNKLYNNAALLFVFALLGGAILLALRVQERGHRKPPPMLIVGLHAAMALLGLGLLVKGFTLV